MRIVLLIVAVTSGAGCAALPATTTHIASDGTTVRVSEISRYETDATSTEPRTCAFGDFFDCAALCNSNQGASCNNLGAMFEVGDSVDPNARTAIAYYRRACASGAHAGCTNLERIASQRSPDPAPTPAIVGELTRPMSRTGAPQAAPLPLQADLHAPSACAHCVIVNLNAPNYGTIHVNVTRPD